RFSRRRMIWPSNSPSRPDNFPWLRHHANKSLHSQVHTSAKFSSGDGIVIDRATRLRRVPWQSEHVCARPDDLPLRPFWITPVPPHVGQAPVGSLKSSKRASSAG